MIEVLYRREVPYPLPRLMSQFFDLEHIAHVHPRTFGEARLVTSHENTVVWESLSPRYFGLRLRNVIHQEYIPPDQIRFRFVKGTQRGLEIQVRFAQIGESTSVDERFLVPLPGWSWLRFLVRAWIVRTWNRIWEEDLRVGMCHGGWPGVPSRTTPYQPGTPAGMISARSREGTW